MGAAPAAETRAVVRHSDVAAPGRGVEMDAWAAAFCRRRHLDESQRAVVAAKIATLQDGQRQVGQLADVPTQSEHSPLPIETVNHESHHALGRLTSPPKSRVWPSWRCGRIGSVFLCCSLWSP
jgi:hypothetical protein